MLFLFILVTKQVELRFGNKYQKSLL